jgi:hypothetical protein
MREIYRLRGTESRSELMRLVRRRALRVSGGAKGAYVHAWRPGHWYTWMFEVGDFSRDADDVPTFTFSAGGNQGGALSSDAMLMLAFALRPLSDVAPADTDSA